MHWAEVPLMAASFKRLATGMAVAILVIRGTSVTTKAGPVGAHAPSNAGKVAFERICARGHGVDAAGTDVAPPLVPFTRDTCELLAIVRQGGREMPAISADEISDDDVFAVAGYLRHLTAGDVQ